jgi:ABC-2 type transport system permease protein
VGWALHPWWPSCVAASWLAVEFGWLALAVGAVTGRRGVAIGVATAAAIAAYLLYVAGRLVEAVEPWRPLSPFDQALGGGSIGAGLDPAALTMPLTGAVLLALALPFFARRDIAAAR